MNYKQVRFLNKKSSYLSGRNTIFERQLVIFNLFIDYNNTEDLKKMSTIKHLEQRRFSLKSWKKINYCNREND